MKQDHNYKCFSHDREERVANNIVPEGTADVIPGFATLIDGTKPVLEIVRELESRSGERLDIRGILRKLRSMSQDETIKLKFKRIFSQSDLVEDLRKLGIENGDTLLVHSSGFSLGKLENGAETLFGALEEAVGQEGTVCLPAFSYNTIRQYPELPFDFRKTPCRIGVLPDLFWRRPGVLRSRHPSHGLAASGSKAGYIIADNLAHSPYDINGAFGRLYRMNAKIVMIGSGLQANSSLHVLEDWAGLPSMEADAYHYIDDNGNTVKITYGKEPFKHRAFYNANNQLTCYEKIFTDRKIIDTGDVGIAKTFIMPVREVIYQGLKLLEDRHFDLLFCRECAECMEMREKLKSWNFPSEIYEKLKNDEQQNNF